MYWASRMSSAFRSLAFSVRSWRASVALGLRSIGVEPNAAIPSALGAALGPLLPLHRPNSGHVEESHPLFLSASTWPLSATTK
jgi:hypothetical protein